MKLISWGLLFERNFPTCSPGQILSTADLELSSSEIGRIVRGDLPTGLHSPLILLHSSFLNGGLGCRSSTSQRRILLSTPDHRPRRKSVRDSNGLQKKKKNKKKKEWLRRHVQVVIFSEGAGSNPAECTLFCQSLNPKKQNHFHAWVWVKNTSHTK